MLTGKFVSRSSINRSQQNQQLIEIRISITALLTANEYFSFTFIYIVCKILTIQACKYGFCQEANPTLNQRILHLSSLNSTHSPKGSLPPEEMKIINPLHPVS